ncbi:MAG: hypothetical protein GY868_11025, partial [Deltaproteobacteria bacterium]|nr:hypothetical protein [Deltaproteobacteria bacterium]
MVGAAAAVGDCPARAFFVSTDARKPVDNPVLLGYSEQMQSLTEELIQIRQAGLYRQLRSVSSQSGP